MGMRTGNISTPVIRTGFTAARIRSSVAVTARPAKKLLRESSRIEAILPDGVFVQIESETRQVGQQDESILNAEYLGRAHQFTCRFPLLLRQIRAADDFLPFAVAHGASGLNVAGKRE